MEVLSNKRKNMEELKTLLKTLPEAVSGEGSEEMAPIREEFQCLTSLIEDCVHIQSEGDLRQAEKLMSQCKERCKAMFNDYFAANGTSYEETIAYFSDWRNFTKNDFDSIQEMKDKLKKSLN